MTLTTEQVAERLHCTPRTVRQYAQAGRITASYIGRRWLFTEDAIAEFLDASSNRERRPVRRRRRRTA